MSERLRSLKNKIVLVTGGGQGIGFNIADNFLENGATVTLLIDINETKGVEAATALNVKYGEKRAVFYKCDVTTGLEEVSNKILEEYEHVDVLVNSAGVIDELAVRKTIHVNTIAVIEWTMKFFEHMRTDKGGNGGTILNLASVYGFMVNPFVPVYKASKFAVFGFSKTLGHEINFNKFGVRILALCPSLTDTDFGLRMLNIPTLLEDEYADFIQNCVRQKVERIGEAAVEIFKKADSGTAWRIKWNTNVELIPDMTL